jgi:ATP-dependent DNA helicase PIF1
MIGRVQLGRSDRRLRQAFPQHADETLGGLPALFFGDFAQLPPIGDTPLFSSKDYEGTDRVSLLQQGKTVYRSLNKPVTLTQVFRQQGDSPDQVKLCQALLGLRTYSTIEDDYQLFQRCM